MLLALPPVARLFALHCSGEAEDTTLSPFIAPRWRPFDPDVPQIPHTFPPRWVYGRGSTPRFPDSPVTLR